MRSTSSQPPPDRRISATGLRSVTVDAHSSGPLPLDRRRAAPTGGRRRAGSLPRALTSPIEVPRRMPLAAAMPCGAGPCSPPATLTWSTSSSGDRRAATDPATTARSPRTIDEPAAAGCGPHLASRAMRRARIRGSMRRRLRRPDLRSGRTGPGVLVSITHPSLRARRSRPAGSRARGRRPSARRPGAGRSCISANTSSAEPPSSAWMKLACLVDTAAVPRRTALAPGGVDQPAGGVAGRVREHRAGVLAAGLVGPTPAHDLGDLGLGLGSVAAGQAPAPPRRRPRRWCSDGASGSRESSSLAGTHAILAAARGRRRGPSAATRPCPSRGRRRSCARRRRSSRARRPPTRSPVSPAAAVRRATTGRAPLPRRGPCTVPSTSSTSTDANARRARRRVRRSRASATSRFEPLPDDQHVDPGLGHDGGDRVKLGLVESTRQNSAAGPPTR